MLSQPQRPSLSPDELRRELCASLEPLKKQDFLHQRKYLIRSMVKTCLEKAKKDIIRATGRMRAMESREAVGENITRILAHIRISVGPAISKQLYNGIAGAIAATVTALCERFPDAPGTPPAPPVSDAAEEDQKEEGESPTDTPQEHAAALPTAAEEPQEQAGDALAKAAEERERRPQETMLPDARRTTAPTEPPVATAANEPPPVTDAAGQPAEPGTPEPGRTQAAPLPEDPQLLERIRVQAAWHKAVREILEQGAAVLAESPSDRRQVIEKEMKEFLAANALKGISIDGGRQGSYSLFITCTLEYGLLLEAGGGTLDENACIRRIAAELYPDITQAGNERRIWLSSRLQEALRSWNRNPGTPPAPYVYLRIRMGIGCPAPLRADPLPGVLPMPAPTLPLPAPVLPRPARALSGPERETIERRLERQLSGKRPDGMRPPVYEAFLRHLTQELNVSRGAEDALDVQDVRRAADAVQDGWRIPPSVEHRTAPSAPRPQGNAEHAPLHVPPPTEHRDPAPQPAAENEDPGLTEDRGTAEEDREEVPPAPEPPTPVALPEEREQRVPPEEPVTPVITPEPAGAPAEREASALPRKERQPAASPNDAMPPAFTALAAAARANWDRASPAVAAQQVEIAADAEALRGELAKLEARIAAALSNHGVLCGRLADATLHTLLLEMENELRLGRGAGLGDKEYFTRLMAEGFFTFQEECARIVQRSEELEERVGALRLRNGSLQRTLETLTGTIATRPLLRLLLGLSPGELPDEGEAEEALRECGDALRADRETIRSLLEEMRLTVLPADRTAFERRLAAAGDAIRACAPVARTAAGSHR